MNVLLYVMDAVRADHLSCYGYDRETTPNVDELAADGVRFENCFTPATWTRPVAASILTGSYPPTHGTQTRYDTFSPHVPSLAEQFRSAGFETVGISSMGNVSSSVGFDRGFDEFVDLYKDEDVREKRRTSTVVDEELKQENVREVALPRAEDVTTTFEDWLTERDDDTPFFSFVWSIEPHEPYDPPEGFRTFVDPEYSGPVDGERESFKAVDSDADLEHLKALYDGEIAYNDACIGDLVDGLRRAGELEDTVVVVLGDHGEAFNEHGRLSHGHAPYDELIHVPCVVRTPSETVSHVEEDAICSLIDLYPTLLEYATDTASRTLDGVQGRSLSGALHGRDVDGREYVFSETNSYDMQNAFYGVRSAEWKYIEIQKPDWDTGTLFELLRYVFEKGIVTDILRNPGYYLNRYRYSETERLYRLSDDPAERHNVIRDAEEKHAEFKRRLREWLDACQSVRGESAADTTDTDDEIDAGTREQLRQLGYTE